MIETSSTLIDKIIAQGSTWAIVFSVLLLALVKIYTDLIKPYFTNRIEIAKEVDKETKLKAAALKEENVITEKYNLEEKRWDKIFVALDRLTIAVNTLYNIVDNFVQDKINNINYNFAERVIKMSFENSALRLQSLLTKILNQNHRLDTFRQTHIKSNITSFLKIDEQDICEILRDVRYNNVSLVLYFDTINQEHKDAFVKLLLSVLFDANTTSEKVLVDIIDIVKNHYKTHISEALDFINKKTNE